jgi:hypothetical protein
MHAAIDKDRYFRQNVIGISGVEFLWGLGLPLVVESTFLQLFLKSMGASSFVIGLIPFFFFIGISVFALLSSYFTANMEFKRSAVIWLHLVSGFSLLLIGASLLVFNEVTHILFAFFCCYAVFSVCVGMTLPVWLNYLVKIFSAKKSVAGLSYMIIAQNAAKLTCSIIIIKIVDKYAFSPGSSSIVFMVVGTVFALGSLLFLLTKEVNHPQEIPEAGKQAFFRYVIDASRHIIKNKNFLYFLAGDAEIFVVITMISFYANYATTYCGIDPAIAAGVFVGCIYCGAIFANLMVGTLGLFSMKHKYVVSKLASISAVLILALTCRAWGFYLASFLLGISRGTRMLIYAPAVKRLSGLTDSTSYFAIGPIFTLPFATLLPLVTGKFLDRFSGHQADAYRVVFITAALLAAVALLCILKTDFSVNSAKHTFSG